ncbi:Mitochondrial 50S ribosomal protein [Mycena indigotica]|uniref:Mitochondrial 50S ribosomal protein n=1 Tax=Mycena indigotica TaxID=2126181 RepID=A0A8H6SHQ4_9AGAR|nr:Mitochondrial 50S ribosomal protein [Mycena indigotica]KAF7298886.1 Mitochondrial 50S ribosomal protein [Mycena indigotica]
MSTVSQPLKRAQLGLFQNKIKQYGNNVPFSLHKTRRTWLPNVQRKRFFSETLQDYVQVKVTTAALKTIKKVASLRGTVAPPADMSLQKGGIDNYVTQTNAETLGWRGMQIRTMVRDAQEKSTQSESSPSTTTSKKTPSSSRIVRYARRMAARTLGFRGLASAEETLRFMKDRKFEQDRRLPQIISTSTG